MTKEEFNDMTDALKFGHDLEFSYKNERFFLENFVEYHGLYKMTSTNDGILIQKIEGSNIKEQIDNFLSLVIFDKPISQIYSEIEILDIE